MIAEGVIAKIAKMAIRIVFGRIQIWIRSNNIKVLVNLVHCGGYVVGLDGKIFSSVIVIHIVESVRFN